MVACILSFAIIFAIVKVEVDAVTNLQIAKQYLLSNGFTEEVLNTYGNEFILELYEIYKDEEITCVSEVVTVNMEPPDPNLNMPMDEMSPSELTFTVSTIARFSQYVSSFDAGQLGYLDVVVSYNWAQNKPVIKAKDAIILSYDDSVFVCLDSNFFTGKSYYETNVTGEVLHWNGSDRPSATTGQDEVGWEFPIAPITGADHYGNGRITFMPAFPMYVCENSALNTYATRFNATYYHSTLEDILPNLSLNLGKLGFSLNFMNNSNHMSASRIFSFLR